MSKALFTNQTANGDSAEFNGNGRATVKVTGTFDGASLDLQTALDGDDSFDSIGATTKNPITAPLTFNIEYSPNVRYRFNLSSAGASTDISVKVTK